MSRVYSDRELKIVSQLAYCNLDSETFKDLKESRADDTTISLQELFQKKENSEKNGSECGRLEKCAGVDIYRIL